MKLQKVSDVLSKHLPSHARRSHPVDMKLYIRRPKVDKETPAHSMAPNPSYNDINRLGLQAIRLKISQVSPEKNSNIDVSGAFRSLKTVGSSRLGVIPIMNTVSHMNVQNDFKGIGVHEPYNGVPPLPQEMPLSCEESENLASIDEKLELKLLKYEGLDPILLKAVKGLQKLLRSTTKVKHEKARSNLLEFFHRNGNTVVGPAYLSFLLQRVISITRIGPSDDKDILKAALAFFEKGSIDLNETGTVGNYKSSSKEAFNDLSLSEEMNNLLASIQAKSQDAPSVSTSIGPKLGSPISDDRVKSPPLDGTDSQHREDIPIDYSQISGSKTSLSCGRNPDSCTVRQLSCEALSSFIGVGITKIRDLAVELDCNPEMLTAEEASFIIDELNVPYSIDIKVTRKNVTLTKKKQIMINRSLVVTIMGHVDHGKTTLLDTFQKSDIASGEAGMITQKLGAFKVTCEEGTLIFLDTPGHAAFGRMRDRGVKCADLVILVVAADDGVMPQTLEAIELIKRERLPFIVAINKVDLDEGLHVKGMLEDCGLDLTDVPLVYISAKKGHNIDKLKSELFSFAGRTNLMVNASVSGMAYIFETSLHPTWGSCLRAIVRSGTIKEGGWLVCGEIHGKVKRMFDANGTPIKAALPSEIVQLSWSNDVSTCAGTFLHHCDSQLKAQKMAALNKRRLNSTDVIAHASSKKSAGTSKAVSQSPIGTTGCLVPEIGVVLRCGDQGGLDAVLEWINDFNVRKRRECDITNLIERGYVQPSTTAEELASWEPIRIVAKNVGPFNRSDAQFVDAGIKVFLGFCADLPDAVPRPKLLVTHNIIYELFTDIEKMYNFYFGETHLMKQEANARVTQVGSITIKGAGKKQAIGTNVSLGTVRINNLCMLIREGKTLAKDLEIYSMQSSRKQATELLKGDCNNCIVFKECPEVKAGDEIVSYTKEPLPPLFGIEEKCILE